MWLFLSNAFFSIVADKTDPDRLLVRARFSADIRRVFPAATVRRTPKSDYRYRASISRDVVAHTLASTAREIDYLNFKDTVPAADRVRHDAYLQVWASMHSAQEERVVSREQNAQRSRKRRAPRHKRFEDAPLSSEPDSQYWWIG